MAVFTKKILGDEKVVWSSPKRMGTFFGQCTTTTKNFESIKIRKELCFHKGVTFLHHRRLLLTQPN